jgi:galactofuranose transport system substrate-binding protein
MTKTPRLLLPRLLAAALALAGCAKQNEPAAGGATPAIAAKKLTIGFAQTGAESAWRTANTASFKAEAEKRGYDLKFSDGQGKQEVQIAAVKTFITQGVDAIVIAPIVETGWEPVLQEAKAAKIPVIISDRTLKVDDPSLYACFVGSDFKTEGKMVADWLIKRTGGKGKILELQGTTASAPANDRHSAFVDAIKGTDLTIIDSQDGDFHRDKGKEVMEAFLKKYSQKGDFDIVYAHNDDMALGAIQAIEAAGLKPGQDVLVVSIDGTKDGVQAVADGKINCVVECNPLTGALVYDIVEKVVAGQPVPPITYNHDELFDSTNAAAAVATRQY